MQSAEQAQTFAEAVVVAMRRRSTAKRRFTITELARRLGYRRETVSRAINQNEFPEVRRAIAQFLGLT